VRNMDKRIKCTACRRMKMEEDFKKNQKMLKTCISCREKPKKVFLIESAPVPELVTKSEPDPILVTKSVPESILVTKSEPEPILVTKSVPESILVTKSVPESILVTKSVPESILVTKSVPKTESVIKWIGLSGYWIREGDEQKLHKKLTRKLNRQFHMQSAFPIHKYLTQYWMVDIRDRYSPFSE
jgi:hypothetical protein